jgi:hypothetical protein
MAGLSQPVAASRSVMVMMVGDLTHVAEQNQLTATDKTDSASGKRMLGFKLLLVVGLL